MVFFLRAGFFALVPAPVALVTVLALLLEPVVFFAVAPVMDVTTVADALDVDLVVAVSVGTEAAEAGAILYKLKLKVDDFEIV